ncbi:hypothetical protein PUN28_006156 [Cardiocondyla obscurior]|uniref:Uncharacterized protein n=1 Tax=Cardiocondyla obscurior TaxID=286306 RepID=A0AAW2GB31_9HYME
MKEKLAELERKVERKKRMLGNEEYGKKVSENNGRKRKNREKKKYNYKGDEEHRGQEKNGGGDKRDYKKIRNRSKGGVDKKNKRRKL